MEGNLRDELAELFDLPDNGESEGKLDEVASLLELVAEPVREQFLVSMRRAEAAMSFDRVNPEEGIAAECAQSMRVLTELREQLEERVVYFVDEKDHEYREFYEATQDLLTLLEFVTGSNPASGDEINHDNRTIAHYPPEEIVGRVFGAMPSKIDRSAGVHDADLAILVSILEPLRDVLLNNINALVHISKQWHEERLRAQAETQKELAGLIEGVFESTAGKKWRRRTAVGLWFQRNIKKNERTSESLIAELFDHRRGADCIDGLPGLEGLIFLYERYHEDDYHAELSTKRDLAEMTADAIAKTTGKIELMSQLRNAREEAEAELYREEE